MATPYDAPYKVAQRKAKAAGKGRPIWTSVSVEVLKDGTKIKRVVQGTYIKAIHGKI